MTWKVPLMRDAFLMDQETREALSWFVLRAPRLSMGEQCEAFETEFAKWQGRKHAVLFNSGSSANLALVQALLNTGVFRPGDPVAVSALTWATSVMPLIQLGLRPVAVDVDPVTLRTRPYEQHAAFLTNPLGFMASTVGKGIYLEDNCESLGTESDGVKAGNVGMASTFSFFVGHHLSTIEGGMVCTDEGWLMAALRMTRAHGWDRNLSEHRQKDLRKIHGVDDFHAPYTFYDLGYNLRPTEITGFLGRTQLPLMDEAIKRREEIYLRLEKTKRWMMPTWDRITRLSPFCFPCIPWEGMDVMPERIRFKEAGIETRPLIAGNITRHPFWKAAGLSVTPLPGADYLHDCGFYVPLRPDMTEQEIEIVEGCLS